MKFDFFIVHCRSFQEVCCDTCYSPEGYRELALALPVQKVVIGLAKVYRAVHQYVHGGVWGWRFRRCRTLDLVCHRLGKLFNVRADHLKFRTPSSLSPFKSAARLHHDESVTKTSFFGATSVEPNNNVSAPMKPTVHNLEEESMLCSGARGNRPKTRGLLEPTVLDRSGWLTPNWLHSLHAFVACAALSQLA